MPVSPSTSLIQSSADDADDFADALDEWADRTGANTLDGAIREVFAEEMQTKILNRARSYAAPYVGSERAQDIGVVDTSVTRAEGTNRRRYTTGLETDNVVVMSHERGTGVHGGGGKYRIVPKTDDVLRFSAGGADVYTEVVKHPGVRGKRFIYRALKEEMDDLAREARENTIDALERALDTR